ncbi:HNH endonuclease [Gilvimarinus polysaccharolyticus]|uniref:HNH endonuclease n=1 Tax=Gilvimarinus polysaccharolyticus TaxID=863921 RepID=UPI000673BA87|nr:HNH endonuclease [Gilvimarinus polysaccharolyticus]
MSEYMNQGGIESSRKASFKFFLLDDDKPRSNKVNSYVRALDLICEMIKRQPVRFNQIQDLWSITSTEQLEPLHQFLIQESRNESSIWMFEDLPASYLRDGFCSAAIKQYHKFLIEKSFEDRLVSAYIEKKELDSSELALLESDYTLPRYLIDAGQFPIGTETLQLVKQRTNQSVFRNILRKNYRNCCCITGLNISAVNRASHIIGWAKDPAKRLDPRNGLYLSATYDAAFDKHLISLDDDYRVILSAELKEFNTQDSFKKHFLSIEGMRIFVPKMMPPDKDYLAVHRKLGSFK